MWNECECAWISLSLGFEDENNQNLQGVGSTGNIHTMRSPRNKINIRISFLFQFTADEYALFCGEKSIRCYRIEKLVQLLRATIVWSKLFRISRSELFYAPKTSHTPGT
jgi:hypothetical protein